MYRNLLILVVVCALPGAVAEAGATACTAGNPNTTSVIESTPTSAFTDNGDGTVTHNLTGLTWKQCTEGLSGAGCATGTASTMTWSAALAAAVADATAGHQDWRLPNYKELASISEFCGYEPAINQTLFPATPFLSVFWSGSSYGPDPTAAIGVLSYDGEGLQSPKTMSHSVRLVRGGRAFGSFDADHPPTLDVDGNGTADAFTDGLLVIRYLFGLRGASLIQGAVGVGATRTTATTLDDYIASVIGQSKFDIDDNQSTDALTDGLLIIRYLFGLRDASLIQGAVGASAQRTSATDIENYVGSIMP